MTPGQQGATLIVRKCDHLVENEKVLVVYGTSTKAVGKFLANSAAQFSAPTFERTAPDRKMSTLGIRPPVGFESGTATT